MWRAWAWATRCTAALQGDEHLPVPQAALRSRQCPDGQPGPLTAARPALAAQLGLAPAEPASPGRAVLEPLHWGGADILATPYGHCVAPDGTYQVGALQRLHARPARCAPRCARLRPEAPLLGGQPSHPAAPAAAAAAPQVRPASEAQRRLAASHLHLDDYAPPGGPDFGASGRRPPPAGALRSQVDHILHQRCAGRRRGCCVLRCCGSARVVCVARWQANPPQQAAADGRICLQACGAG